MQQQESLSTARSGLMERIEALISGPDHQGLPDLTLQLDLIRRDAYRHGFMPAAQLAATLGDMLASGSIGRAISSSLDLMRDALECEDNGQDSGAIYIAALTSRFGH